MQSHMTHAILNNEAPSPHVYGPVSYRSVQADQGHRLAAFKSTGDTTPPVPTPWTLWSPQLVRPLHFSEGRRSKVHLRTGTLRSPRRHLDFPFLPLNAFPSRPRQAHRREGTWHGAARGADGDGRRGSFRGQATSVSGGTRRGCVPGAAAGLAWEEASVNAALMAAARPSRWSYMCQLLTRICMLLLPRTSRCTLHCACVYRHRSTSQQVR